MPNAQGNTRTFRPPVIIQKFPVFIYMRQVRGNFQYVNVRKLHPNVRKNGDICKFLYEKMMPFFVGTSISETPESAICDTPCHPLHAERHAGVRTKEHNLRSMQFLLACQTCIRHRPLSGNTPACPFIILIRPCRESAFRMRNKSHRAGRFGNYFVSLAVEPHEITINTIRQ